MSVTTSGVKHTENKKQCSTRSRHQGSDFRLLRLRVEAHVLVVLPEGGVVAFEKTAAGMTGNLRRFLCRGTPRRHLLGVLPLDGRILDAASGETVAMIFPFILPN
jgi:hypothetical protein